VNDAAVTTHSVEEVQRLMAQSGLPEIWSENQFEENLAPKFNHAPAVIKISEHQLKAVHDFVYPGSTISDSFFLDSELSKHLTNASTTMSRLTKCVWENNKLRESARMTVYPACIVSTLLASRFTNLSFRLSTCVASKAF